MPWLLSGRSTEFYTNMSRFDLPWLQLKLKAFLKVLATGIFVAFWRRWMWVNKFKCDSTHAHILFLTLVPVDELRWPKYYRALMHMNFSIKLPMPSLTRLSLQHATLLVWPSSHNSSASCLDSNVCIKDYSAAGSSVTSINLIWPNFLVPRQWWPCLLPNFKLPLLWSDNRWAVLIFIR